MNERELVIHADEVAPFSLPDQEDIYVSQCIIEKDGVGSSDLFVNRFTLRAHKSLEGGIHPENDEAYYVLRGRGKLYLGGCPDDGVDSKVYDVVADTAIFIPAGTYHRLENHSDEDIVILTIWPRPPRPNGNRLYELRQKIWGTTFRKVDGPATKILER